MGGPSGGFVAWHPTVAVRFGQISRSATKWTNTSRQPTSTAVGQIAEGTEIGVRSSQRADRAAGTSALSAAKSHGGTCAVGRELSDSGGSLGECRAEIAWASGRDELRCPLGSGHIAVVLKRQHNTSYGYRNTIESNGRFVSFDHGTCYISDLIFSGTSARHESRHYQARIMDLFNVFSDQDVPSKFSWKPRNVAWEFEIFNETSWMISGFYGSKLSHRILYKTGRDAGLSHCPNNHGGTVTSTRTDAGSQTDFQNLPELCCLSCNNDRP